MPSLGLTGEFSDSQARLASINALDPQWPADCLSTRQQHDDDQGAAQPSNPMMLRRSAMHVEANCGVEGWQNERDPAIVEVRPLNDLNVAV